MGLLGELPKHVGIIMDGNGRWANQRGLARMFGHRQGVERLHGIIESSSRLGIEALSLYAFSTENWKRPKEEVSALMSLLLEYFGREIEALHANKVQIRAMGDISKFTDKVQGAIEAAMERTKDNEGLRLNIAVNYGSRDEMVRAIRSIAKKVCEGKLEAEEIGETVMMEHLYTAGLPDVDLIIRTGGEKRLSNFLLMQGAYAELVFVDAFWPDFTDERYFEALREFQLRTRRYGGIQ